MNLRARVGAVFFGCVFVVGLASVDACNGKTAGDSADGSGGTPAGAGGAIASEGAGVSTAGSGADAGAGAGAGAGASAGGGGGAGGCTGPGTCVLVGKGCCGACDPTAADLTPLYWKEAQAYLEAQCPRPVSCGACPPDAAPQSQNLAAFCEDQKCTTVDVRTDDVSSCHTDSDCQIAQPGCCAQCQGSLAYLALNKTGYATYHAQVCNPEQPTACPHCVPPPPHGAFARCNGTGHCEVAVER